MAKEVCGADGVAWLPDAEAKAKRFEENPAFRRVDVDVKTGKVQGLF